jgi:hypothetical protein
MLTIRRYEGHITSLCHSPATAQDHYKVTWPWARLALCGNSTAKENVSCTQKTFFLGCSYTSNIFCFLRFSFVTLDIVFTWRHLSEINENQYRFWWGRFFKLVFPFCFLLACYLAYSSILKMMAIRSSEMLINIIRLHGVIFQKTILFVVTVLTPSNITFIGSIFAHALSKFVLKISGYK